MRPPKKDVWDDLETSQMGVLFGQALDEKLFEHTVDSYRARTLNTHTCTNEIELFAREAIDDKIPLKTLQPITEDLREKIKYDSVIRESGNREIVYEYVENIKESNQPKDILSNIRALNSNLDEFYWDTIKSMVSEKTSEEKVSSDVIELADKFISESEYQGYHKKATSYYADKVFRRSEDENKVEEFLSYFDDEVQNYEYVFRVSDRFLDFEKTHVGEDVRLMEERPNIDAEHEAVNDFLDHTGHNTPNYLIFESIESKDPASARQKAERILKFISSTLCFNEHQNRPEWYGVSICIDEDGEFVGHFSEENSPMEKRPNFQVKEKGSSPELIQNALFSSQLNGPGFRRLTRSLNLHRAALEASTASNQLLDLWSALEGLLPVPPDNEARINHFTASILPIMTSTYTEKIFHYLGNCLLGYDEEVADFVDEKGVGESFTEKSTSLVVCSDLESHLEGLLGLLNRNPLLRYRIFDLNKKYGDSESVINSIESHRKRVERNICRIYANRNRLSHDASSMPFLDSLVENLHFYFDSVVDAFVSTIDKSTSVRTISDIISQIGVNESIYLNVISEIESDCKTDNYRQIIFGDNNFLQDVT